MLIEISYNELLSLGFFMIIIGFFIVFVSIMILVFKSIKGAGKGEVEGGGVIVIGPIPIVFGTSKRVTEFLLILAIILFLLALVFFLLPYITFR